MSLATRVLRFTIPQAGSRQLTTRWSCRPTVYAPSVAHPHHQSLRMVHSPPSVRLLMDSSIGDIWPSGLLKIAFAVELNPSHLPTDWDPSTSAHAEADLKIILGHIFLADEWETTVLGTKDGWGELWATNSTAGLECLLPFKRLPDSSELAQSIVKGMGEDPLKLGVKEDLVKGVFQTADHDKVVASFSEISLENLVSLKPLQQPEPPTTKCKRTTGRLRSSIVASAANPTDTRDDASSSPGQPDWDTIKIHLAISAVQPSFLPAHWSTTSKQPHGVAAHLEHHLEAALAGNAMDPIEELKMRMIAWDTAPMDPIARLKGRMYDSEPEDFHPMDPGNGGLTVSFAALYAELPPLVKVAPASHVAVGVRAVLKEELRVPEAAVKAVFVTPGYEKAVVALDDASAEGLETAASPETGGSPPPRS